VVEGTLPVQRVEYAGKVVATYSEAVTVVPGKPLVVKL
jgi:hypothetical protein